MPRSATAVITHPAARLWRRGIAVALLAAALAGPRLTASDSPASAGAPIPLPRGTVEAELAVGEVRSHPMTLAADHYLRLLVVQDEVDVEVRLFSPAGEELLRADGPAGRRVPELISLVTRQAGEHRLEIRAAREGESGPYVVEVEDFRAAVPSDVSRVAAEAFYVEAVHLGFLGNEARREAIGGLEQALLLWQRVGDPREVARTLTQIGWTRQRLGENAAARQRYQQALELWRQAGAGEDEAVTLTRIGRVAQLMGRLPEARRRLEQALEVWRRLGEPAAAAFTHQRLGSVRLAAGEAKAALAAFEQARRLRGGASASLLNSIAVCHRRLGDTPAARAGFEQVLELSRQQGDQRLEAGVLNNLGLLSRQEGDLRQALEHYRRALEINRERDDVRGIGNVLQNLGSVDVELGKMEQARGHYRQALERFERAGDRRAVLGVTLRLARVSLFLGDAEPAKKELAAALAAADDPGMEAEIRQILGVADKDLGDLEAARSALRKSLDLWRGLGNRPREASVLADLGLVAYRQGDLEGAKQYLEQAVRLAERTRYHAVEIIARSRSARVERDLGHLEAARGQLEAVLELTERQRVHVPTPELRARFFARKRSHYDLYLDVLLRVHERGAGPEILEEIFALSERAHARSFRDLLHERSQEVRRGVEPALLEREKAARGRLSQLETHWLELVSASAAESAALADLRSQLEGAQQDREELELEIRRRHPRYAALRYPEPPAMEEVRRALGSETALLEYTLGEDGAVLLVLTAETLRCFRLPASSAEIGQLVERARRALGRPGRGSTGGYQLAAWRLYEAILAPARELLEGKKHLLVVADRSLHTLPFETLLTRPPRGRAGEPSYLLARWSVSYVPSAAVLTSLASPVAAGRGGGGKGFVAFADAVLAEGSFPHLPRLVQSEHEVREIAGLYPEGEAVLLLGSAASEQAVKGGELPRTAARLHFATHGILAERQPRLVLAPGEPSQEDGILHVYEVFNLELGAEMVVLSACDSGLGEEVPGEGLMGLSRAFLYAGAARVVASLWRVDDRSTADLMVRFYRGLESSGRPAEALRQAKLGLIRDSRFAHPHHWGPFVLIGAP